MICEYYQSVSEQTIYVALGSGKRIRVHLKVINFRSLPCLPFNHLVAAQYNTEHILHI